MGQVPGQKVLYGIVGGGRMARHMSHYLRLLNIPFKIWKRRDHLSAQEALKNCSVILLLITDSEIEPFYKENSDWLKKDKRNVVHFSGSLVINQVCGFHPLMTFGQKLYNLDTYKKIIFVCEEEGPSFKKIFPKLENKNFKIPRSAKPLYHAFCVMSGNFSTLLWQRFFEELTKRWGIPKEAAFPYLEQMTQNLLSNSKTALTGPLQRKDLVTIRKNQKALSKTKFKKIYDAFVESYL